MTSQPKQEQNRPGNARVIRRLMFVVIGMFGFGFALVPLYDIFCDITGINGKTGDQATLSEHMQVDTSRLVEVEFIASLNANMPWEFKPLQHSVRVHPGEPTRVEVAGAVLDGGWIPTVGPAFPMSVLSLAPAEHEAMVDISEVLYLAPRGGEGFTMGNQHVVRDGLTRSQIEFVASRTSLINDCFF